MVDSAYETLKRIQQYTWTTNQLQAKLLDELRELTSNVGMLKLDHGEGAPIDGMSRAWLAAMVHHCSRLLEMSTPSMSLETALNGMATQELMSYCHDGDVDAARRYYAEIGAVVKASRIQLESGRSVIALTSPSNQLTRQYLHFEQGDLMPNPNREYPRLSEISQFLRSP